jgi:molybdopterin molybdotransferase
VNVPLWAALGAISAEEVLAASDVPERLTASRDGWAVSFAAIAGASQTSPVVLPFAPCWVEAGETLPPNTDSVVPPEAVDLGTEREVIAEAAPGEGCVGIGAEFAAGDRIIEAGERIGPLHHLALACAGPPEIAVRRPRIALLATGGERDRRALEPTLTELITAFGAIVVPSGPAPDDFVELAETIGSAAKSADAVFVLGGTGMGRRDRSAAALARAGSLAVHGVALRPGGSVGFGQAAGRTVLLLPGRPEAALATYLALGVPLLRRLAGRAGSWRREILTLSRKVSSGIGVTEIVFVRRVATVIEPLGSEEIPMHRLLEADGWIMVPPDREGYPAGTELEMMRL